MFELYGWARKWGVSAEALQDLFNRTGLGGLPASMGDLSGASEASVQARARVNAAVEYRALLWRNNVGVTEDHIRYGLCNDSKQLNAILKSSDLIGVVPRIVTQEMVGGTVGLFAAVECKPEGWAYAGTPHEKAQLAYGQLVQSRGGLFQFYNGGEFSW